MADSLLEKKTNTFLDKLSDLKAIAFLYTFVDTLGKTEAKKLYHTLAKKQSEERWKVEALINTPCYALG